MWPDPPSIRGGSLYVASWPEGVTMICMIDVLMDHARPAISMMVIVMERILESKPPQPPGWARIWRQVPRSEPTDGIALSPMQRDQRNATGIINPGRARPHPATFAPGPRTFTLAGPSTFTHTFALPPPKSDDDERNSWSLGATRGIWPSGLLRILRNKAIVPKSKETGHRIVIATAGQQCIGIIVIYTQVLTNGSGANFKAHKHK
ncbi:hypothetical protein BD779DRAFT_1469818 [Infundibulicybe gibba]|nr:hypothetical protein BD779DRAFT_1469818 [Infundibulicybe gibba]